MHDVSTWRAAIRHRLWELQADRVGWGYGAAGPPTPNRLSWLAWRCWPRPTARRPVETLEAVHASAEFLRDLQQADGAVGVADGIATPRWPTAYAALLWSQIPGYDRPLACALHWLQQDDEAAGFFSDDQIVGGDEQPWRGEPIRGVGNRTIPGRYRDLGALPQPIGRTCAGPRRRPMDPGRSACHKEVGPRTIRTCADSGSYPQAAATGMALLALRAANLDESHVVTDACHYLTRVLASSDSPAKFGWAWLGYHAWRPRTLESEAWLSRLAQRTPACDDDPAGLAMWLLAGSSDALAMLGVVAAEGRCGRSTGLAQELLGV